MEQHKNKNRKTTLDDKKHIVDYIISNINSLVEYLLKMVSWTVFYMDLRVGQTSYLPSDLVTTIHLYRVPPGLEKVVAKFFTEFFLCFHSLNAR